MVVFLQVLIMYHSMMLEVNWKPAFPSHSNSDHKILENIHVFQLLDQIAFLDQRPTSSDQSKYRQQVNIYNHPYIHQMFETNSCFFSCSVDPTVPIPARPIRDDRVPVAGEPYFIDCRVMRPGLTNDDILWIGPDSLQITSTSGRVSVGDVMPDESGGSIRRLTFNPLSTEDSGLYMCLSPAGPTIQTLTVQGTHTHTSSSSSSSSSLLSSP